MADWTRMTHQSPRPEIDEEQERYADAIVETTRQPFLVLDADLSVLSANRAFCQTFQVASAKTLGRRLYDLGNGQWNIPELRNLLDNVLRERHSVEDYRVEHDFEDLGCRIMLLNAHLMKLNESSERILLAISDVTEHERARKELEGQKEYADKLFDSVRDPLLVLGRDLRVRSANAPFFQTFQVPPEETVGRLVYELGNGQWNIPELRELLDNVLPDNKVFDDFRVEHEFEGIGRKTLLLNGRRLDHLDLIVLAIEDITDRLGSEQRQKLLMAELQHRVKNILMNVRALVWQTQRDNRTLNQFVEVFENRLAALARTQDLLLKSDSEVGLDALLRMELAALGADEGAKFTLQGPPVRLPARAAEAMAMTTHELATNAAKYGALKAPGGRIEATWRTERREGAEWLSFEWRERGVTIGRPPKRKGFGTHVIENGVTYLFRGSSNLNFTPEGVEFVLEFSLPED